MDSTPQQIIALTEAYAVFNRRAESTISRLAVGSWDQVSRLRDGHDITTRRASKMFNWFHENWPADLEWPVDIPRPENKEDAA